MNKHLKLYVIGKSSSIFEVNPMKLVEIEEIKLDKKLIIVNNNGSYQCTEIEGTLLIMSLNRSIPGTKYQDYEFWRVVY